MHSGWSLTGTVFRLKYFVPDTEGNPEQGSRLRRNRSEFYQYGRRRAGDRRVFNTARAKVDGEDRNENGGKELKRFRRLDGDARGGF